MLRMLSRRTFAGMTAASLAGHAFFPQGIAAESVDRISIMMWTLNKLGTFEENLERVARAGYHRIEMTGEFHDWSDADYRRILARMQKLAIQVDATSGVKAGFAHSSGGDEFLAELKQMIPIAKRLGCGQIILLSGSKEEGVVPGTQKEASIEALKRAVEPLRQAGLVAVIEPIDRLESPTIYLDGVSEAFEIARAVNSPSIRVLYDVYHEQRQSGNLLEKFDANIAQVGLVHIADVPGRHEPGTGEINYSNVYRKLSTLHYTGNIAMEFFSTADTEQTLRKAREQALALLM